MGSTTGNTHCSMISIHSRQRSRTLSRIECCNHWRNQTHQDYSRGVLGTLDLSTATLWIEFYLIQRNEWISIKPTRWGFPVKMKSFHCVKLFFMMCYCYESYESWVPLWDQLIYWSILSLVNHNTEKYSAPPWHHPRKHINAELC